MGIVLSVLVAVFITGCGTDGESDKKKADDGASSLKPPPRDFRDRSSYKKGRGVEAISETIKLGVPKSAMPAYPHIAPADRRLVALFIESLQSKNSLDDSEE